MEIRVLIENEKFWTIFVVIVMIGIFINSSRPIEIDDRILLIRHLDKLLHIFVWIILAMSLRFGSKTYIMKDQTKLNLRIIIILGIAISYGIIDEIHQYFVPSRVMDIWDILADTLGSIIGFLIALNLLKNLVKKKILIRTNSSTFR